MTGVNVLDVQDMIIYHNTTNWITKHWGNNHDGLSVLSLGLSRKIQGFRGFRRDIDSSSFAGINRLCYVDYVDYSSHQLQTMTLRI